MNKPHLGVSQGRHKSRLGHAAEVIRRAFKQKVLASDPRREGQDGQPARGLLAFANPASYTTAPFVHDHWEEVYLISGDLVVGNDEQGQRRGAIRSAPTYACRPPGVPSRSVQVRHAAALLYEIHYYDGAGQRAARRASVPLVPTEAGTQC